MKTPIPAVLVLVLIAAGVAGTATRAGAQSTEEQARRRYAAGLDSLNNHRYQEALKDFRAVAEQYPTSSVADDALLEIARYELEIAGSPQLAQESAETLLKNYKDSDTAPMAHVLLGRIAMARGRTQPDIDAALASFERVERIYPRSRAVPAALLFKGQVLRLVERNDEAIAQFRDVTRRYPRSVWAARAHIALSLVLTRTGDVQAAIEELQRVRVRFADLPEAVRAAGLLTTLYRLYVLPATGMPPYQWASRTLAGPSGRLRDVLSLTMSPNDELVVTNSAGALTLDQKGAVVSMSGQNPAFDAFFSRQGRLVVVGKGVLSMGQGVFVPLAVPQLNKPPRPLGDVRSAIALSTGDVLVIDADTRSVQQFTPTGSYVCEFSKTDASRLALDQLDHVALLDRESTSVVIADRDRHLLQRIIAKGQGYELKNPVDLSFDAFGHVYVLDRGSAAVWVFTPRGKLVTAFSIPEKSPGAFTRARALTLDSAGRLYIFDERAEVVQVYQ